MAFSTPAWIGALSPPDAKSPLDKYREATASGLDLGQRQAAYSALRNTDINSTDSLNAAQARLVQTGNVAVADALNSLGLARHQAATKGGALSLADMDIANERNRMASGAAQPSINADNAPQTPAHMQIMQDAAAALTTLQGIKDPVARKAAADQMAMQFRERGVPQENIDEITGDLSDAGLKAHADHLSAVATGGDEVAHPTGFAASKGVMANPVYAQAQESLQHFAGHPWLQAAAESAGLPIGGAISRDMEITAPQRSQEAAVANARALRTQEALAPPAAPFGAVNTPNPTAPGGVQVQTAQGGAPTVQALSRSQSAGSAAGSAPYTGVQIPTPSGAPAVMSGANFAANQSAPGAGPITGQTPGAAEAQRTAGGASARQAAALQARAGEVPARKAALENMRELAGEFSSGPHAGFWTKAGQLAQEYGLPVPKKTQDKTSAQEEFNKLGIQVMALQRQQMGLPSTDASSALTSGAVPNDHLSPQGIQRVAGLMEGNEDYLSAQSQAWQKYSQAGNGAETFGRFQSEFNRLFDPRVFQAQYMTQEQRDKVRASVGAAKFDAQVKAAQKLGWISGK